MADVFISHVEEDSAVALEIADALEAQGWSTWCYERDSLPGPSYLVQTSTAVEQSRAVVVVISPHSLGSHQVTAEVVRGHEASKPFVPVLVSLSHVEFAARQPEWREAIGAATSIAVPPGGVAEVLPRIVLGLQSLGLRPSGPAGLVRERNLTAPFVAPARRSAAARLAALPRWLRVVPVGIVLALVAVALVVTRGGGGQQAGRPDATAGPTTVSQGPLPGPAVDPDTTPLQTNMGEARITAAELTDEFCPPPGFPGACKHPAAGRYLVLTLHAWNGAGSQLTIWVTQDANRSYVLLDGKRYDAASIADETRGDVRIVYAGVPPSAAGRDVALVWPGNPEVTLRVTA